MAAQPSSDDIYVPEIDEVEHLVLETLLIRHPALVAMEELIRDVSHPDPQRSIPETFVHEAVHSLAKDGLAHRLDRFVFASHSAVRAGELRT